MSRPLAIKLDLVHAEIGGRTLHALYGVGDDAEPEHAVFVRLLGWCLLHEPGLVFGPRPRSVDTADLWKHDDAGNVLVWAECGEVSLTKLRAVATRHRHATLVAVHEDEPAISGLRQAASLDPAWLPEGGLVLIRLEAQLSRALAGDWSSVQRWLVTIGAHDLTVEISGRILASSIRREQFKRSYG